ncbi:hypothetical protein RHMOL_Rhmol06G0288800 [Rhododendron molle]|uniref:Uncharacterized protein n=1 Tax=Rhododendron molle TaxID=49168 RepID=A0ACC0NHN5_RHOML|nr:hypothetical protein RHMOL_Rhmol06G0288800 [Rhododendron molle]
MFHVHCFAAIDDNAVKRIFRDARYLCQCVLVVSNPFPFGSDGSVAEDVAGRFESSMPRCMAFTLKELDESFDDLLFCAYKLWKFLIGFKWSYMWMNLKRKSRINLMVRNNIAGEVGKTQSPSLGENKRPQTSSQRSMSQGTQSARSEPYSSSKRHKATEEGSSSSLQGVPPDNLKQLLVDCAKALSENEMDDFEKLVDKAQSCVSISGEPIQHLVLIW